jgi:anhydro-N-acetylmuramic acid kinase
MAKADHRYIIGLMSGTSLDGLDLAYCQVNGSGTDTKVQVLAFETIGYNDDIRQKIRKVFAQKTIDFASLAMLNEWIGILHAGMINTFISRNNIDKRKVDVIASHGQTVMHAPKHQHGQPEFPNATMQIGDGDHIAMLTGFITISDFRQKHLAAGGEGAPLAVYGDYLIFSKPGENRIMLNIGGISNFTFLPADGDINRVFVSDTGPGNTLMDAYMKSNFNQPYDIDSKVASQGNVNDNLLYSLMDLDFFRLSLPKTTGPEVFNMNYVQKAIEKSRQNQISTFDVMATLNYLTASTIAHAIKSIIGDIKCSILTSGGGAHNPLLCHTIKTLLPDCSINPCDHLGIAGDAKEAVLFAVLANETLAGRPLPFNSTQKIPNVCMGKISFPS